MKFIANKVDTIDEVVSLIRDHAADFLLTQPDLGLMLEDFNGVTIRPIKERKEIGRNIFGMKKYQEIYFSDREIVEEFLGENRFNLVGGSFLSRNIADFFREVLHKEEAMRRLGVSIILDDTELFFIQCLIDFSEEVCSEDN